MRSRPCTSLLPRPNGLSEFMSGHEYDRTSWLNDETVPLINLGREASQLLHSQQCPYRVRIQGRLATVRTVSVSNLGKTKSSNPISCTRKNRNYVPLWRKGQKNLYDSSEDEEDLDEYIVEDDRQFRGYGIGGAGNIRRPTDIIGASSRSPTSTMPTKSGKLRLGMSRLLHNLRGYRRDKGSAAVS